MKSFPILIILAVALVQLSGCSITPTHMNSDAYKIAMSGGINDIRDTEVEDNFDVAASSTASYDAVFNTLNMTNTPGMGMSLNSLGAGLAMTVLGPRSDAQRNSLFAWLPASGMSKDEALVYLHNQYSEAVQAAAQSMAMTTYKVIDNRYDSDWIADSYLSAYVIESPEHGCPAFVDDASIDAKDYCYFGVNTYEPDNDEPRGTSSNVTPFGVQAEDVYAFTVDRDYHYSRAYFKQGTNSDFNELAIYKAFSEAIPTYAFMYLAPKKTLLSEDEKLAFPILLHKGEPMLFIKKPISKM